MVAFGRLGGSQIIPLPPVLVLVPGVGEMKERVILAMAKKAKYTLDEIRRILLEAADENNVLSSCSDFESCIREQIRSHYGGWNAFCATLGLIPAAKAPTRRIVVETIISAKKKGREIKPIPRMPGSLKRALGYWDELDEAERGA